MGPRSFAERRLLEGHVTEEVFRENLTDFDAKSQSNPDRFGKTWKPLAPSTIRRKLGSQISRLNRARRERYERVFKDFSAQAGVGTGLSPSEARALARRAALVNIGEDPSVPINIETGRLRRSLEPGWIGRAGYRPRKDQLFKASDQLFRFGTRVPYAKYVDRVRPIVPAAKNSAVWVRQGIAKSLLPILRRLQGDA